MTQPGSFEGYRGLFEDPAEFRNEVCARALLTLGAYAPARAAAKVRCPLFVCLVGADAVTPAAPARAMASRAPAGELVDYGEGWGHFDIYRGELFERAVADQTEFLVRSLRVAEPAVA